MLQREPEMAGNWGCWHGEAGGRAVCLQTVEDGQGQIGNEVLECRGGLTRDWVDPWVLGTMDEVPPYHTWRADSAVEGLTFAASSASGPCCFCMKGRPV